MERIFELTNNLANALEECECFKNYTNSKIKISSNTDLCRRIKEFKGAHLNFQAKLLQNIQTSFDEERHVSKLYADLLLNDDARLFLESEKIMLEIIAKVYSTINNSCKIDMDIPSMVQNI